MRTVRIPVQALVEIESSLEDMEGSDDIIADFLHGRDWTQEQYNEWVETYINPMKKIIEDNRKQITKAAWGDKTKHLITAKINAVMATEINDRIDLMQDRIAGEDQRPYKGFLTACKLFMIDAGYMIPISQEDYDNAQVFGCAKSKVYPLFRGQRYEFTHCPQWIDNELNHV